MNPNTFSLSTARLAGVLLAAVLALVLCWTILASSGGHVRPYGAHHISPNVTALHHISPNNNHHLAATRTHI